MILLNRFKHANTQKKTLDISKDTFKTKYNENLKETDLKYKEQKINKPLFLESIDNKKTTKGSYVYTELEESLDLEDSGRLNSPQKNDYSTSKVFLRVKESLKKTRKKFSTSIIKLFSNRRILDQNLIEDIETQLITSDMGLEVTEEIIALLRDKKLNCSSSRTFNTVSVIKEKLREIIVTSEAPLIINKKNKPYIILLVGVNGSGKTTTAGKLARKFQDEGNSVILAAGDTFRAAAVDQLKVWGARSNIPVISQHHGADSASVIYDAVEAARSRDIDIVIADTAGRLHNKSNLMEELKKIVRVIKKLDYTAPHEIILTIDAVLGQNSITQAEVFNDLLSITGIILTKMDGTAKGGVIFPIAKKFQIPIRFIGTGEKIEDLYRFNSIEFVNALFS